MCPNCKAETPFDSESGYYICTDCEWYDISEPFTFICDWCGNEELEDRRKWTKNNEAICLDCFNII